MMYKVRTKIAITILIANLTVPKWVHCLFLFPLVFMENVNVTCKIVSFLCSLDNLLLKNVIVFSIRNQISRWCSFEKKGYFRPTFYIFLFTRETTQ